MADVVISYAPENEATARQLGEGLAQAGYEVWRPEGGVGAANADAITDQIVSAKAVVVIWSSAAAVSEWVRAEANIARGLKKLVQASADGNPPPIPFDAAQVASISTWLGDDAHPGWEAIRAGVAGLAGTPAPDAEARAPETLPAPDPIVPPVAPDTPPAPEPEAAAEPEPEPGAPPEEPTVAPVAAPDPEPAAPPTEPEPPLPPPVPDPESLSDPAPASLSDPAPAAPVAAAASPAAPAPRRGPSLALILIILFVLIVLAAAGYVFWQRSQPPASAPATAEANVVTPPEPAGPDLPQDVPLQPGAEAAPPANESFDRQAMLRGGGPAAVRSAPTAQGFTVGQIQPGERFQTYQQDGDWWRVRTASGVTGYVMASAIALQAAGAPAQQAQATTPGQPQSRPAAPRRAEPRVPRQRIRKENSEVMEQFCAGAGRNTPQCRRFRQSY
jgi:hypothetical protein